MKHAIAILLTLCGGCFAAEPVIGKLEAERMSQIENRIPGGSWERITTTTNVFYYYTADVVERDGTKRVLHWTFMFNGGRITGDYEQPHGEYVDQVAKLRAEKKINAKHEKLPAAKPLDAEGIKKFEQADRAKQILIREAQRKADEAARINRATQKPRLGNRDDER